MEKIRQIMDEVNLDTNLSLDEIPNIDLYMDQVIQLFEKRFAETKRNEEEKILTKTMINNYAKGKLIFPIKNKKYSKDHLILMSLIYQLKGSLSINDINAVLSGINKRIIKEDINLDSFYSSYLNLTHRNVEDFKRDIEERVREVNEEIAEIKEGHSEYLEQVLMISSLIHMSNLYRKIAERLVDQIPVEKEGKRQR
jgi:DNA-binding transcriptional MerR regulator